MYGVSTGNGADVAVCGSKEWRTADLSQGEYADLRGSVSEKRILSTLYHTHATIWRATVGPHWQRDSVDDSYVSVCDRIPTLMSVWNDGWIRLSRFQRKMQNWLIDGHEESNPTRLKDLCRLKVSEQITTAVQQAILRLPCRFLCF